MKFITTILGLSLSGFAAAQISAAPIISAIAPNATECASDNDECRTAEQAAPWIALGMFQHGVFSTKEMAAVISLMAFESVEFQYKHNLFPGRPGQGTANMQMAKYNLLYAQSIPALKSKVAQYGDDVDKLSDGEKNKVLALVTPDQYNFASGPWFLATQCDKSVRDALVKDVDAGFKTYMEDCVGVEVTDDRLAYLERAKKAFHLS